MAVNTEGQAWRWAMTVDTAYAFVYYTLYRAIREQGRDGIEVWKAAWLLCGVWVFLILDILLLLGLFIPSINLEALRSVWGLILAVAAWCLVYFPLLHKERWKRYEVGFDTHPALFSRIARSCVLIALALVPVSFFVISFMLNRVWALGP